MRERVYLRNLVRKKNFLKGRITTLLKNNVYQELVFLPLFQVLTRDSVTVSVDAVVYYRVSNATISVANVENAHHSTRLLAQTTLRNILGTKNLHEILSDRESISSSMQVGHFGDLQCLIVSLST